MALDGPLDARSNPRGRGPMLTVLANRTYRHLFLAQVLSLLGTGLTTVALGLLAFELAGAEAGLILGTALAIKMVAYVGVAPLASALTAHVPRRRLLIALDCARAGLVLTLPFVSAIWQIYLLVFAFQSLSAAFTPAFQSAIPDILPDEADYTRALSLSRLAYDLEALLSPLLAGALLSILSFHWLFAGNALGFLASAALVASVALPLADRASRPFAERLTRGSWIYLATPRLRGLLALYVAVAAAGAMVIVNTVVLVKADLGLADRHVALFFAAYGLGSMTVALCLPRLLERVEARPVMLAGGALMAASLAWMGSTGFSAATGLLAWTLIGAGASVVQTPAGLLLKRSSHAEDRPALFAAQFALSHSGWLLAYPAAGWLLARNGEGAAFLVLAFAATLATLSAAMLWPRNDPSEIMHEHEPLEHAHGPRPAHDPHHARSVALAPPARQRTDGGDHTHGHRPVRHVHAFVIDDHHPHWPRRT